MASIDNLDSFDPFAESGEAKTEITNQVHIRCQQRNGRKTITTVQGIPGEYDLKRILKTLKKEFGCNGHINNDEELGDILQFQGDQREKVQDFLVSALQIPKTDIKMHGF